MTLEELESKLGTPAVATLTIGDLEWKFSQPTTYPELRAEEKRQAKFVAAMTSTDEEGRNNANILPEQRALLPVGFDADCARMVYILHKRCVSAPTPSEDGVPISLPDAIKMLRVPKFLDLVDRTLAASAYNETANALAAEVEKEKNALSEIRLTDSGISPASPTSESSPTT